MLRPAASAAGRAMPASVQEEIWMPDAAASAPAQDDIEFDLANAGPFSGIAFGLLSLFIFVSTSRILDFGLESLHLPMVLSVVTSLFTVASGGLTRVLQARTSQFLLLFSLWFAITLPFSQWRGGSFSVFMDDFSKAMLLFVMIVGVTTSVSRVRKLMLTILAGATVTLAIALVMQSRVEGRLTMAVGQFANSNDLAQILLVGLCFLPILTISKQNKSKPVLKLLLLGIGGAYLYAILDTGSRAAVLTLVMLVGVAFLQASGSKKILIAGGFTIVGLAMFVMVDAARQRVGAMFADATPQVSFSSQEEFSKLSPEQQIAIASQESRWETLKDSVILTLQNPAFGVGPGVFVTAAAKLNHAGGKRAYWVETHNSFTQVSSETGVPGFLLFTAAVVMSILGLVRIRKRVQGMPQFEHIESMATYLLLGYLSFIFTSIFSSVAYKYVTMLMFGVCAAAITAFNREIDAGMGAAQAAQAIADPAPVAMPTLAAGPRVRSVPSPVHSPVPGPTAAASAPMSAPTPARPEPAQATPVGSIASTAGSTAPVRRSLQRPGATKVDIPRSLSIKRTRV